MKKLISFFLALVMLLSLTACGTADKTETEKNEKNTVSETEKGKETENGFDKESVTEEIDDKYKDEHGELAKSAEENLPGYILEAIRAYYGLPIGAELTDKMIASVEEVNIAHIIEYKGKYCIDATINGSTYYGIGISPGCIKEVRFNLSYLKKSEELSSEDKSAFEALTNYFIVKDLNAEGLSEAEREKIEKYYPECQDGAIYVLKYDITPNQIKELYNAYEKICDVPYAVETSTIDLSCLDVLPNLQKVLCKAELTAVNCPVEVEVFNSFE